MSDNKVSYASAQDIFNTLRAAYANISTSSETAYCVDSEENTEEYMFECCGEQFIIQFKDEKMGTMFAITSIDLIDPADGSHYTSVERVEKIWGDEGIYLYDADYPPLYARYGDVVGADQAKIAVFESDLRATLAKIKLVWG